MFMLKRKLVAKFVLLFLLVGGVIYLEPSAKAMPYCPICPVPYTCNGFGQCVCECPNLDGSCPSGCY